MQTNEGSSKLRLFPKGINCLSAGMACEKGSFKPATDLHLVYEIFRAVLRFSIDGSRPQLVSAADSEGS